MRTIELSETEADFLVLCVNLVYLRQMILTEPHERTVALMEESLDRGTERYEELVQQVDHAHIIEVLSWTSRQPTESSETHSEPQ